jgi:hypothetical protein
MVQSILTKNTAYPTYRKTCNGWCTNAVVAIFVTRIQQQYIGLSNERTKKLWIINVFCTPIQLHLEIQRGRGETSTASARSPSHFLFFSFHLTNQSITALYHALPPIERQNETRFSPLNSSIQRISFIFIRPRHLLISKLKQVRWNLNSITIQQRIKFVFTCIHVSIDLIHLLSLL